MIGPAAVLLLALLAGRLAVELVWPGAARNPAGRVFSWSLSFGLGMGLVSCFYFLTRVAFRLAIPSFLAALAVLIALLAFGAWFRRKPQAPIPPAPPSRVPYAELALFAVAAIAAAVTFVLISASAPHGEWDAWSIWNLRARFLARAPDPAVAFSPALDWSHPDYPLLVPGAIAAAWSLAPGEPPWVPAAVAFLFWFASAGILTGALAMERGWRQALLAGLVLVATPQFLRVGATQYADVPLAFFILATVALLVAARQPGPLLLAGLSAASAAWTKNEGLLAAAVTVSWVLIEILRKRLPAKNLLWFAAGLAPLLAVNLWFKLAIAPPNDLIAAGTVGSFGARAADFGRYWTTAASLIEGIWNAGGFFLSPVLMFLGYLLCLGADQDRPSRSGLVAFLICSILVGYAAVYVLASGSLDWQISTSLPRLLLHVWPAALFAFFLFVRTPCEIALPDRNPKSRGRVHNK